MERRPRLEILNDLVGRELILGIRPEDFKDAALAAGRNGAQAFETEIALVEPTGSEVIAHFELAGTSLVARLNPRTSAAHGRALTLVADVERLYLFDPGTELRI